MVPQLNDELTRMNALLDDDFDFRYVPPPIVASFIVLKIVVILAS